jgi:hypothetical protein
MPDNEREELGAFILAGMDGILCCVENPKNQTGFDPRIPVVGAVLVFRVFR